MFFKKPPQKKSYNKETQLPIIKCSICTGEQVAGFKDIHTGKFEEVMLIKDGKDLDLFKAIYEVDEVLKEY